jgi:hypothetical protein
MTPDEIAALRDRLLDLRLTALQQLAASEGIDAGLLRLAADASAALTALDAVELAPIDVAPRPRGGDMRSAERARRDEALRQLAAIIGADVPAERFARDLAGRLARYRPAVIETAPERLAMRAVVESGLPVPAPDRLARIIRAR